MEQALCQGGVFRLEIWVDRPVPYFLQMQKYVLTLARIGFKMLLDIESSSALGNTNLNLQDRQTQSSETRT